jgi:hypothetical protein
MSIKGILRRIGLYEKEEFLVFQSDFNNIPQPKVKLEYRALSFKDLEDLTYFKIGRNPKYIQRRFNKGCECFGFFLEGKFAYAMWLSHDCLEDDTGRLPPIKIQNSVWLFDGFTMPEFRRLGVYASAGSYIQEILKARGETKALTVCAADNLISKKAIQKAGFYQVFSIDYRRVFFFFIHSRPQNRTLQGADGAWPLSINF